MHEDGPERVVRVALSIRRLFTEPDSPASQAELHVCLGRLLGADPDADFRGETWREWRFGIEV